VPPLQSGGVGLPDRDYYVSEDADSKEKREKYALHVKMLGIWRKTCRS
jgi:endothelin-converting enzyme/putative endopeptidase